MLKFVKKDVVRRTISKVEDQADINHKTVQTVVTAVFDSLKELMLDSPEVEFRIELRNFGVFEIKRTSPKLHASKMSPQRVIRIAPHRRVLFRPGGDLRGVLRQPLKE